METIKLHAGSLIPIIGSGTNTFGKENRDYRGEINYDTTELKAAIVAGYRHFDTAISYRNEGVLGKAVEESGIAREEFFITSKIPGREEYYKDRQAVVDGIESSLKELRTDYIDLYLIHHPWDDLDGILMVWQVLEEYAEKGILKEIGVSNFSQEQIDFLLKEAKMPPAVNQIQSNPTEWNHELIDYLLSVNVVPEAWGPLSHIDDQAKASLTEIGDKYGKSWAQVLLKFQIDRAVVVIPKSHNTERQKANLELFDFELTSEDKKTIYNL